MTPVYPKIAFVERDSDSSKTFIPLFSNEEWIHNATQEDRFFFSLLCIVPVELQNEIYAVIQWIIDNDKPARLSFEQSLGRAYYFLEFDEINDAVEARLIYNIGIDDGYPR